MQLMMFLCMTLKSDQCVVSAQKIMQPMSLNKQQVLSVMFM
jgi:hypothetical protein